MKESNETNTP